MLRIPSLIAAVAVAACSAFGVRTADQPSYTVIDRIGDRLEIREYPPLLAADTVVPATDADTAGNAAFRILFDYISGANQSRSKIAMTAPVAVESERIAITVPVQTSTVETDASDPAGMARWYAMRFLLPSFYTMETAPKPTDERVRLISVPAQTLAVLCFSGSRSEDAVTARKEELVAALSASKWQAEGEAVALFYDPPWTLWFLRRNEVAVAVNRTPAG